MPCVNKKGDVVASGWTSPAAFKGHLEALAMDGGKVAWATGQLEKGEETGALHIQCLVRFKTAQRFTAVIAMMSKTDHWEIAENPAACANYCQKPESRVPDADGGLSFTIGEGDPREAGAKGQRATRDGSGPGQGARSDIAKAVKKIQAGAADWEIMDESPHLMVQYPRMAEQARAAMEAKRRSLGIDKASDKVDIRVVVLWGASNSGKSHRARYWVDFLREYRGLSWTASAPVIQNGMVWADNYSGEDVILMEDFNPHPEGLPPVDEELFLRLLDVWARPTASRKGRSAVTMRATWWFFTSNHDPQYWWPSSSIESDGRFTRRISYLERMVKTPTSSSADTVPEDLSPLGLWVRTACSPLGPVTSTTALLDPSLLLSDGSSKTPITSPAPPATAMKEKTTGGMIDMKHVPSATTTNSTATAGSKTEQPSMQYTPRRQSSQRRTTRGRKRKSPATTPGWTPIDRMASKLAWETLEKQMQRITRPPPEQRMAPWRPRLVSDEAREAQARNLQRQQQTERKVRAERSARLVFNIED